MAGSHVGPRTGRMVTDRLATQATGVAVGILRTVADSSTGPLRRFASHIVGSASSNASAEVWGSSATSIQGGVLDLRGTYT